MPVGWQEWLLRLRPAKYGRKQPLVLVNGLAEQYESWYRNHRFWGRYFDVHMPHILAYEGVHLHQRIKQGLPITVDYLVEELRTFVDRFIQTPPYHFVASSLGGKVMVEFAARYPELVSRLVLLCPSGMGDEERLPLIEGVRHNDMRAIVESVFYKARSADSGLMRYYRRQFPNRRWKMGMLRAVNGTKGTTVRDRLPLVKAPTLLVSCEQDRIVDPREAEKAAQELPNGQFLMIPNCGHAPQIEKPWLINRLVVHFLTHPRPSSHPRLSQLLLNRPSKVNEQPR